MTRTARTALAGTGIVVAAVVLGGCGPVGGPTAAGTASTTPAATSPGPPAATTSDPAPTDPATTATSRPSTSTGTSPSSTPTTSPSPTQSPTPTATTPTPRTTLHLGDKGDDVLALQKKLSAAGYWLGTPDGVFGGLTLQAVYAVQKVAGIGRDGVVGPRTVQAVTDRVRPHPRTTSGAAVEIDIQRQVIMIVRGGSLLYTLNTSTGSGQTYQSSSGGTAVAHTPLGSYAVSWQIDGPDNAPLGLLWRPKFFTGGYAVHGSGSVPPYPASHGCARVSNEAMNMIWASNLMPIGTKVLVY